MNVGVGSHIGVVIGSILHVEVDSSGNGWDKFLILLVEVNLYKPLPQGTMLSLPESKCFISFLY